jgi:exopolysaccharide production protein ExoQ
MQQKIGLVFCILFVVFLIKRDIKQTSGVSKAINVPLFWLIIAGSRSIFSWLNLGASGSKSLVEAYQEGNPLDRNIMILVFICGAVILSRRRLIWSEIFQKNRVFILYFIYCLVSVLWSDYPFVAFKRFITFAGMMILILVVLSEEDPIGAILAIMRRSSYILISFSLLFIKFYPDFGRYYNPHTWEVFYCGVGDNKNSLGILCIISVVIFFWDFLQRVQEKNKILTTVDTWIDIVFLGLSVYFLKIADSSTSLVCSAIGIAILLVTAIPFFIKNPKTVGFWAVCACVVLLTLQVLFDIKGTIIVALGRPPDLKRKDLWDMLFSMVENPIVGSGFESFWTIKRLSFLRSLSFEAIQSHNGYIDTYLNLGFVGVFFFIAIIFHGLQKTFKEMTDTYEINRVKLALITIFVLYNYTEAGFPRPGYLIYFFLLCIIQLPETANQQRYNQNQIETPIEIV